MDGATLLIRLRNLLQERSDSDFLDDRTSYDYLYQAVTEFVRETGAVTASQTITTTASTSAYDLNPDFMHLYMVDDDNDLFVKYYDASTYTFIKYKPYDAVVYANNTTAQSIPDNFTIRDKRTAETNLTGTCTSTGALTNGETALNDSAAPFTSVKAGDTVHNTTDGSSGVVVYCTSTSSVQCALFGGTDNTFTNTDAYVVVPQRRKQIVFDPATSTAAHTATVEYIKQPDPVYSNYRTYPINPAHMPTIITYAAWLYKYRDREPNFGDAWYKQWDLMLRKAKAVENKVSNKSRWRVSFTRRSYRDRSMR